MLLEVAGDVGARDLELALRAEANAHAGSGSPTVPST